jgi:hypothetical protein
MKPRYRYLQAFLGNTGKVRLYFRRKGHPRIHLPGPIGSLEFLSAYQAALAEPRIIPSALPGGVVRSRGRRKDPNAVQPLIGVYLLMHKGKVVYVGESLNMPKRVAEHRSNGRPFDQAYYIATVANQRANLERILIRAINPPGNRVHRVNGECPSIKTCGEENKDGLAADLIQISATMELRRLRGRSQTRLVQTTAQQLKSEAKRLGIFTQGRNFYANPPATDGRRNND